MTLKQILPPFPVYCNTGLFIVVQRRIAPFDLSFNRTWDEYKNGFGDLNGEFWLGLEKLHLITNQPYVKYLIRFEVTSSSGKVIYTDCDNFYIGDGSDQYVVKNTGNCRQSNGYRATNYISVNDMFYTPDKDNINKCASLYNGFWNPSRICGSSHLHLKVPMSLGSSGALIATTIQIRPVQV